VLQTIKISTVMRKQVIHINTLPEVKEMVKTARQLPLSHISISFAFTHESPGVFLKNSIVHDIRSIRPVKLAVVLVAPRSRTKAIYHRFVVDLSKPQLIIALSPLFNLSVPFVGYDLKPAFFCLWQLGLPEPDTVWGGHICEQALHLGRYFHRYAPNQGTGVVARISAKTWSHEQLSIQTSLMYACQRHAVPYQPPQKASTDQSADPLPSALAAAQLYGRQVAAATADGIHEHLVTVEMPFVATAARLEWTGVRVSFPKRARIIRKCQPAIERLQQSLQRHGLANYRSHHELTRVFGKAGLLDLFQDGSGYSFDRDHLKPVQDKHPSIPLILALTRLEDLRNSELLALELVGADGRIHPTYDQLGAATGRLTCHQPSILNVVSLLRPLVVPEPGRGIGEVDWSQVEVGIAGAVFGNQKLIDMFNTGDVYATMARVFYQRELPKSARTMSTLNFKEKYPDLRNKMKACTLGIIYGRTPYGIAKDLKCSQRQAQGLYDGFMGMFPHLRQAQRKIAAAAGVQGYALTVSNLHRHRGTSGPVAAWEKRWFVNYCIQGTAAVIFKMACNRLIQLYQPYDARLIIPLHDAVVFEAPLEAFEEVTKLTAKVMRKTLREVFPELRPRVTRNVSKPTCWNKDGKVNGLAKWIRKTLTELSLY
jgi:DNA polymerase I